MDHNKAVVFTFFIQQHLNTTSKFNKGEVKNMPVTHLYLDNETYAKLVYLAEKKKKKISHLLKEIIKESLNEAEA